MYVEGWAGVSQKPHGDFQLTVPKGPVPQKCDVYKNELPFFLNPPVLVIWHKQTKRCSIVAAGKEKYQWREALG